jgi:hypothetical protein
MNDATVERCADFVLGALAVTEFSAWLYETTEEDWTGARELHVELHEVDYRSRLGEREVKMKLTRELDARFPGALRRHAARRIARGLVDEQVDPFEALRELMRLRAAGLDEVQLALVGLDSELDEVPMERDRQHWEARAFAEARARLERYRPDILAEAAALLQALERP